MASLQGNAHYSEKTRKETVVLFLFYYFSQFLETTHNKFVAQKLIKFLLPMSDLLQETLHIKF